jgi:hypothetical protein
MNTKSTFETVVRQATVLHRITSTVPDRAGGNMIDSGRQAADTWKELLQHCYPIDPRGSGKLDVP